MRKMLSFLVCFALIFSVQAGAKVASLTNAGIDVTQIENVRVPKAPENLIDDTDIVIFSEDFESGQGDWEFVDLTDVSSWHTDTFNAWSGNSWWAGDADIGGYDNHWLQYLDSPTINLSGTTNPALTFKLFYAMEEPGGEPPPYDGWDGCNVWVSTDGGANWDVLTMLSPAYTCSSMYSFGEEWGMGPGIAGWGGFSGGTRPGVWVDASASLTGYQTSNVKIRFALCSDPVWSTGDDPELLGMFVDNVLIQAGATTYLENDADGTAYPSDLVPTPGMPAVGNYWHMSEPGFPVPPSPTHVMEMSDGAGSYDPDIFNALVSPVIDLTGYTTGSVIGDFYVRGSMNVNDPDPFPDVDNWTVQVQPQGGAYGWYYYSNPWGTPGGNNYVMTDLPATYTLWSEYNTQGSLALTDYIGYEVKVRVLFQSDPDNYFGEGVFVDDFVIEYTEALDNDVGTELMLVPMPTSLYFNQIGCSVEIHNYGINNQGAVPAFWRTNMGTPNPLIPWANVPAGTFVVKEWDWTPGTTGDYFMDSYTWLTSPPDENTSNDTSTVGMVEVTTADVLEFGYDNRQYSYEPSIYYFNFVANEGAYVRYTPQDDGVTDPVSISQLKVLFNDTGTIRVHIYEEGTATNPGPEVVAFNQSVTTIEPNWQLIDVSSVGYLQGTTNDFWVWYEVMDPLGTPHIMGWDDIIHGEGHFFADFGSGFGPSDYDFFARAIGSPGNYPAFNVDLTYVSGSPVPAGGGNLTFDVYMANVSGAAQDIDIWLESAYEGGTPQTMVLRHFDNYQSGWAINRPGMWFPVSGSWAAGNYTFGCKVGVNPDVAWAQDSFPFVKSGSDYVEGFVPFPVAGAPNPFDEVITGGMDLPSEYALLGSYPNPFNPTANISYALPAAGKVMLCVYDVNGRLVNTLIDGSREAGVHEVTFDASNLASGVYIYRLSAGDFSATGKMVLMK